MDLSDRTALVPGDAGFVGSHIAKALFDSGTEVVVADDMSAGRRRWVPDGARFLETDLSARANIKRAVTADVDIVFHLAARPDPNDDDLRGQFAENTTMTHLLLEQCHRVNVGRFAFVSPSTVYGEAPRPTAEDHAPLKPIGVYGASKLIEEGLVSTYAHSHRVTAHALRFANIVGARSRGVVIPDFIKKLRADPETLTILWNGRQEKPYTHVDDCVHAMRCVVDHSDRGPVHTYNLGTETTSVNEIAETVADVLDVNLAFEYTGGTRRLAGDIPKIRLAISKLLETDWEQDHRSNAAVRRATEELARDL